MDWAAITPHSLDFAGPPTLPACYAVVYQRAWPYTVAVLVDPAIMQMYGCFGCDEAAHRMNRDAAFPVAARALTPVTLGYFMADLLLLSQWSLTKNGAVENALMLFHHVASLLMWPCAIYFDWLARYVVILLSYEFTSFWLAMLWVLSAAGLKKSALYKLAGLVFTASFLVIRWIGAVPQLVAMWNAPPWSKELMRRAQPDGIHDLGWVFAFSLVAPHVMNFFWGVKVVQGFVTGVLSSGSKTSGSGGEKKAQ